MHKPAILISCILLTSQALLAIDYHVAKNGKDQNEGSLTNPFLTIGKAAEVVQPGDIVYIHEGTYREYVNPIKAGTSDKRIVFQNFEDDVVYVKGSEVIDSWGKVGGSVWLAKISNSFFKGYNPYELRVKGDFQTYGDWHHRGDVYINNNVLDERRSKTSMEITSNTWYVEIEGDSTLLYANFGSVDPTSESVEINVRELIFFPSKPSIDYITVKGLRFHHAAPNWQAPNVGNDRFQDPGRVTQVGAVGASMCKGWIIENCEVMFSKTAGIMMGENIIYSGQQYEDVDLFGHHIVRNNVIHHCGEYGIAGQKGISSSIIEGNLIQDINVRRQFGGLEPASIKIWNCVDVSIIDNLIRRVNDNVAGYALWIDYGNMNTRISRNIVYASSNHPLYIEANFGPTLIDNNIIVGNGTNRGIFNVSGGTVMAHNLFVDCNFVYGIQNFDFTGSAKNGRNATLLEPHTLNIIGFIGVKNLDNRVYNNVFSGRPGGKNLMSEPTNVYKYNALIDGATSITGNDPTNLVKSSYDPEFNLKETNSGVDINFNMVQDVINMKSVFVDTALIGTLSVSGSTIEEQDGSPITINVDLRDTARTGDSPVVGPLEDLNAQSNQVSWVSRISLTTTEDLSHETTEPPVVTSIWGDLNSAISLYPNPVLQGAVVKVANQNSNELVEFFLFDTRGKKVRAWSTFSNGVNNLDITGIKNGVYLLKSRTEGGLISQKLIINK